MEYKPGDYAVYFPSATVRRSSAHKKKSVVEVVKVSPQKAMVKHFDGSTSSVAKINLEPIDKHPEMHDELEAIR